MNIRITPGWWKNNVSIFIRVLILLSLTLYYHQTMIHSNWVTCPIRDAREFLHYACETEQLNPYLTSPLFYKLLRLGCQVNSLDPSVLFRVHLVMLIFIALTWGYLADRIWGKKAGSVITLLIGLQPALWGYSLHVLPFMMTLTVITLFSLLVFLFYHRTLLLTLTVGVCTGLLVLLRPYFILILPVTLIIPRNRLAKLLSPSLALLVISLHLGITYRQTGQFFLAQGGGFAFYVGNHPERPVYYSAFFHPGSREEMAQMVIRLISDITGQKNLTPRQAEWLLARYTLTRFFTQPLLMLKRQFQKFGYFLQPYPYDVNLDLSSVPLPFPRFLVIPFPIIFSLALAGLILLLKKRILQQLPHQAKAVLKLSYAFVIVTVLTNQIFYFQGNVRELITPVLIFLASPVFMIIIRPRTAISKNQPGHPEPKPGPSNRHPDRWVRLRWSCSGLFLIPLSFILIGFLYPAHFENIDHIRAMNHLLRLKCSNEHQTIRREIDRLWLKHRCYPDFATYAVAFLLRTESLDQVIKRLENIAGNCPPSDWVEAVLGDLYKNTGRLVQARWHLEKAVQLNPYNASAHYALAQLYWALGMYDQAEKHMEHYRRLAPPKSDQH